MVSIRTVLSVSVVCCALPGPAPAQSCSPAVTNESCTVTISRESPSSPLPVRLAASAVATLVVEKRPLDTIQFDVTATDLVQPDAASAVLGALLRPLEKLVTKFDRPGAPRAATLDANTFRFVRDSSYVDVLRRLGAIAQRQMEAEADLKSVKSRLDAAAQVLKSFQARRHDQWTAAGDLSVEKTRVASALKAASELRHPIGTVEVQRLLLTELAKRLDVIPVPSSTDTEAANDYAEIGEQFRDVGYNQARLEAGTKLVQDAQTTLAAAAGVIDGIDPIAALAKPLEIQPPPRHTARSVTIKIARQDALTKATTAMATVVVLWADTRWETSAGTLFSRMGNRTFQNTPIVVSGRPRLDAAGKVETRVSETVTSPTVVPMAMVHLRAYQFPLEGSRVAFLVTGGAGVNPSSGTADFGAGFSLAYRAVVVSRLWHRGRDLELTDGVKTNDELGSSPPALPTQRVWRWSDGWAVSIRVPIP